MDTTTPTQESKVEIIRRDNRIAVYEDSWLIYGRDFFTRTEDADRFAKLIASFTPLELVKFIETEA